MLSKECEVGPWTPEVKAEVDRRTDRRTRLNDTPLGIGTFAVHKAGSSIASLKENLRSKKRSSGDRQQWFFYAHF